MFTFKSLNTDKSEYSVFLPVRKTLHSAGYDLFAAEDVILKPFEPTWVPTGLWIAEKEYDEEQEIFYLRVASRSSFFAKGIYTHPGTIDADFPDEIKVGLQWNPFKYLQTSGTAIIDLITQNAEYYPIKRGEAIAQMFVEQVIPLSGGLQSDTLRTGGYGSTSRIIW